MIWCTIPHKKGLGIRDGTFYILQFFRGCFLLTYKNGKKHRINRRYFIWLFLSWSNIYRRGLLFLFHSRSPYLPRCHLLNLPRGTIYQCDSNYSILGSPNIEVNILILKNKHEKKIYLMYEPEHRGEYFDPEKQTWKKIHPMYAAVAIMVQFSLSLHQFILYPTFQFSLPRQSLVHFHCTCP